MAKSTVISARILGMGIFISTTISIPNPIRGTWSLTPKAICSKT
jgi:hypothetical protein